MLHLTAGVAPLLIPRSRCNDHRLRPNLSRLHCPLLFIGPVGRTRQCSKPTGVRTGFGRFCYAVKHSTLCDFLGRSAEIPSKQFQIRGFGRIHPAALATLNVWLSQNKVQDTRDSSAFGNFLVLGLILKNVPPSNTKNRMFPWGMCACVCAVVPSILDVTVVDVPAGVTQDFSTFLLRC